MAGMPLFDPQRSPELQAVFRLPGARLTRAHRSAILALDNDPQQPLAEIGVEGRDAEGQPALWSVHGQILLQMLRATNSNLHNFWGRLHRELAGFDPAREALPGVTEGGLAWLTLALSPEDDTAQQSPALARGDPREHWEAAVTATSALLQGAKPLLGGEARTQLSRWWQENFLFAVARHHMKTSPVPQVLTWFDRLTTAFGWDQAGGPFAQKGLLQEVVRAEIEVWCGRETLITHARCALLQQIWLRSTPLSTDVDAMRPALTALRQQLAQTTPEERLTLAAPLQAQLQRLPERAIQDLLDWHRAMSRHQDLTSPQEAPPRSRPRSRQRS